MSVDKGFQVDRVLAMNLSLLSTKYPKPAERTAFFQRVLEKAAAMPGVQSASLVSALPLMGETWIDIVGTEHDTRPMVELPSTNVRFISPGYFQTLRVGLRDGRDFEEQDRNRKVAIISASLAQRLWGEENPVGRKMNSNDTLVEVVGVTPDFRSTSLDKEPVNMLYIPYWQRPRLGAVAAGAHLDGPARDRQCAARRRLGNRWRSHRAGSAHAGRSAVALRRRSAVSRCCWWCSSPWPPSRSRPSAPTACSRMRSPAAPARWASAWRSARSASDVLGMVLRQGMMPVLAGSGRRRGVGRRHRALSGEPALPGQPARSAGVRRVGRRPAGRLRGGLPDPRAPRHPRQPHRSPALRMMPASDRMRSEMSSFIQNQFEQNIVTTSVDHVFNWARESSIWPLTFGLACCAIEMIAASTSRFDIARFGAEVFRPSPRQSDLMIVAGTVTLKMAPVLKRIWDQMPDPKWCISMGACSSVGGPFNTYGVLQGVDKIVPVDVYLTGCPPRPENLFYALMKLQDKIDQMTTLVKRPTEVRLDESMLDNFKSQIRIAQTQNPV